MNNFFKARGFFIIRPFALGIGAASFARRKLERRRKLKASKDIAESPTAELEAEPERPKQNFRILEF